MTLLDAHKRVLAQILGVRRTIPEEIINCELDIFSLWSCGLINLDLTHGQVLEQYSGHET
jgi:hypothetical protein